MAVLLRHKKVNPTGLRTGISFAGMIKALCMAGNILVQAAEFVGRKKATADLWSVKVIGYPLGNEFISNPNRHFLSR